MTQGTHHNFQGLFQALGFDQGEPSVWSERVQALHEIVLDSRVEGWDREDPPCTSSKVHHALTAHDAFAYLGKTYGIEVVGIQGISTESEAGVRDIERIVELLVSRKIPAVFVESTVPSRSVEALVAGAKAKGQTVRIGGSLFSDAMAAQGTYEGTYTGMIDHNATTIARALGGTAPATGMTGKLAP